MKAFIFDIKRLAVHDGDGIRTTVFFKGCPLKCVWCHNPEGISFQRQLGYYAHKCVGCGACAQACPQAAHAFQNGGHTFDRSHCKACGACVAACEKKALILYGKEMGVEELMPLLLEDRDFYETSGGGVTLSGGECLCQAEFSAELLKRLKRENIHTAIDTCGYVPKKNLDQVIPYTDVFLYDMKAFDEDVHIYCTGHSNKKILENIQYLNAQNKSIEVRIPYVPDYNDGQIDKMAQFLKSLPNVKKVKVLPYHNYAASKYDALGMENTLPERLPDECAVSVAQKRFAL